MNQQKPTFPTGIACIACGGLFVIAVFIALAIVNPDYLQRIESLSLFVCTKSFFNDCMQQPGGLLAWASTYLTQTFYHPWLGASAYACLSLAIAIVAARAFRLSWSMFPVTLVIPALCLIALLQFGYTIFSLKTPGFAFLMSLGLTAALLCVWGYNGLRYFALRASAILCIAILGYMALGFYGLLAAGLCCACQASLLFGRDKVPAWQTIAILALGTLSIVFVPKIWFALIGGHASMARLYTAQLPRYFESEGALWTPYWLAFSFVALLAICTYIDRQRLSKPAQGKKGKKSEATRNLPIVEYASVLVAVLSIASVFVFQNRDHNFRQTIAMENAIWQGKWEQAIEIARKQAEEPTRLNVILSNIAYLRNGDAPEHMFETANGSAAYATPRDLRITHDAGAMLYSYHIGLINYAYRWAMENKVEYGLNVDQLKMMAKCAILNGEQALARKALHTLSQTAWHKDWAEKYMTYVDDPSLVATDPEFAAILPIKTDADVFIEDNGQLEGYAWVALMRRQAQTPQMAELSMIGAIITRNLDYFVDNLPMYLSGHEHLPRHFQEALLVWAVMNDKNADDYYTVDPEIKNRFEDYIKWYKQYMHLAPEECKRKLQPAFGDTYWFYNNCLTGLRII